MTDTAERRIWRTSPVLIVVIVLFCVGAAGAAWHLYSESGMNTLAGVFAAFSVLCILRIADALNTRIELDGPELKFRAKLRKGHYIAPMIDSVKIADGKLYLIMVDGETVLLPDLGLNPRSVGGAIHVWLKKHNQAAEEESGEVAEAEPEPEPEPEAEAEAEETPADPEPAPEPEKPS